VAPDPAPRADVDAAIAAGAVAVVAYGSNASPIVLARKLGERAAAAVLAKPVVLADTDVVFSAHVSRHGAIPATLLPWPGAEVDAWLLAVPAGAIDALDATEPNYVREDLDLAHPSHSAYVSRHGPLRVGGQPVALADVAARGRTLRALTEEEMLEQVRERLASNITPDLFVLAQIADASIRAARSAALRRGL
jgi:hypothetical protein